MDDTYIIIRKLILIKEYLDDDDEFWDLVACTTSYMYVYFMNHIYKEHCMTSYLTGQRWMDELLYGHEKRCFNAFRMNPSTFRQLCADLETKYGLVASSRMSTLEKL
ncbi:unnamed protein product, partial [Cuscuta epithymum]